MRAGMGVDAHAFAEGGKLVLCGVEIPFEFGLEGVSDADAAIHALVDAILGALGLPDIGTLFPEDDPANRDRPSSEFLAAAAERVRAAGYEINNVDLTIVAQAPRLAPHMDDMRRSLARTLGVPGSRIGLKATTTEGLGFPGRHEGVAALALATLAPIGAVDPDVR